MIDCYLSVQRPWIVHSSVEKHLSLEEELSKQRLSPEHPWAAVLQEIGMRPWTERYRETQGN